MASSSQSDGGWHLEEVYHLCTSDKEEMAKGLRIEQVQVVGDFGDYDLPNAFNVLVLVVYKYLHVAINFSL
jgi:hypothetical protein